MGFISVYTSTLKRYVDFKGRSNRAEFWTFILINSIISAILVKLVGFASPMAGQVVSGIFSLLVLMPTIGVAVRRMHDLGKGGGWVCITFVPIIGAIWLLVLCAMKGEEAENRFGAPVA